LSSLLLFFLYFSPSPPPSTLFPYTTLFRSSRRKRSAHRPRIRQVWCSSWFLVSVGPYDRHPGRALGHLLRRLRVSHDRRQIAFQDRKSTRLNSSHQIISYAVFCLKKKNNTS